MVREAMRNDVQEMTARPLVILNKLLRRANRRDKGSIFVCSYVCVSCVHFPPRNNLRAVGKTVYICVRENERESERVALTCSWAECVCVCVL
jgi:hypothetical protein